MPSNEFKNVEVLWDYDGILYRETLNGRKINVHTWIEFETYKTKEEYWLTYQFNSDWDLVGYSIYPAEWLTIDDDLNAIENQLWWNRWIDWRQPLTFKPLKNMSYPHIKAILKDYSAGRLSVEPRMLAYFKSLKEIDYDVIQKGQQMKD